METREIHSRVRKLNSKAENNKPYFGGLRGVKLDNYVV